MTNEGRLIRWTGEKFVLATDDEQRIVPEAGDVIFVAASRPGYSEALAQHDLSAGRWKEPGSQRWVGG